MVVFPLFENVVCAEPEAMLKVTESDEFVVTLPNWSFAVAVTLNPEPAVWGEETVPMARELTLEAAETTNELELTALVTPLMEPGVAVSV
jgi:hypothetical protein